ncbi:MAG: glycosyltransferase family 4 protein [Bacteroidetes bacterium]|nr:glycosyltransferase family 4 protein [Bacteroidota bacterium]
MPHFHLEYSGGAEIQCYYLAKELLERGWEVHYIRESKNRETTIQEGIIVHGIPKQKGYKKWANREALRQQMEKIQADFWYTRANISYLYWLNKYAAKIGGKVIWAFSRDSQLSYKGEMERFASPLLKAFHFLNGLMFIRSLKKTDIILVQTKYQGQLLQQNFGLSGTHIYNAHPLQIDNREDQRSNRKNQILWIGRMQDFKHPERFLELAESLSELSLQFCMIGPVSEDRNDPIRAKATELPNVRIMGKLPQPRVKEKLLESILLVNTSDYEGFSNTFIEAWSQGVPVLSFHVDPDQIIQEHGLGWVNHNLQSIKKIISGLIEDPQLQEGLEKKCKSFANKNFNITEAVDKLESALIQSYEAHLYTRIGA